ncbi:MAG TPA: chromate efflux transporter [Candidatus Acidoferrales bacterium]|nr:chromate efflux transporter [Candidatus Acidoferrales bacterium]
MASNSAVSSLGAERGPGASLGEVAKVFLKLGAISFGGPAGHIAMMEDELVRRRGWLTREKFLDLLGAVNLIPGPNSTELAIYVGLLRGGWAGLLVAGVSFILPAAVMVFVLAWGYVRYGMLPQAGALLYGTKPVIIAVCMQALWGLGRTAVKTRFLAVLGVAAVVAGALNVNPLLVLLAGGVIGALGRSFAVGRRPSLGALLPGVAALPAAAAVSVGSLFLYFCKVGAVLFGSGYLLLAFLRADLVERWHWLTEAQLLDAIAVSQVTPGPLSTAATFIGYVLAGPWGALLGTIGIFLPGFLIVAASGPLIPRLRQSPLAGAFLDGVNVAAVALMIVVSGQLGRAALVDVTTIVIVAASAVLLLRFRANSAWLVIGGALVGLAASFLHPR